MAHPLQTFVVLVFLWLIVLILMTTLCMLHATGHPFSVHAQKWQLLESKPLSGSQLSDANLKDALFQKFREANVNDVTEFTETEWKAVGMTQEIHRYNYVHVSKENVDYYFAPVAKWDNGWLTMSTFVIFFVGLIGLIVWYGRIESKLETDRPGPRAV